MPELSTQQLTALMSPLNKARVKNRSQGGANLSYLEAWDVKATLIRMFGFGGFSAEVTDAQIVDVERLANGNVRIAAMCTVKLHIPQLDATYTETSVAGQTGKTFGDVADFAIKTAESDALKRACTYLGTQFGLSLYDSGNTNEVIRVIMAPGQEWGLKPLDDEQAEQLTTSLGMAKSDGESND